jgi:hypothetical protein
MADDDDVLTIQGDDGQSYRCKLVQAFDLEGQTYALCLALDTPRQDGKDGPPIVIMRVVERGGETILQTIQDDEEFERAVAYSKYLADSRA